MHIEFVDVDSRYAHVEYNLFMLFILVFFRICYIIVEYNQ